MKKNALVKNSLILLLSLSVLVGCKKKTKIEKVDPAFSKYISAFDPGTVSRKGAFVIRLAEGSKKFTEPDAEIEDDLFDFSPGIKGTTVWKDSQTIEFHPSDLLQSGTTYKVEFDLGEVLDVESKFQIFSYSVTVPEQSFQVSTSGTELYNTNDLVWNSLKGTINAADFMTDEEAMALLTAKQGSKVLKVRWNHGALGKEHEFIVDSIQRKESAQKVEIRWDGSGVGVETKGTREVEIPSLSDFKFMNAEVIQSPEQYVKVVFSDPLKKNQNLKGLIQLGNNRNLRYVVDENSVKVYTGKRQTGTQTLNISKAILNVRGNQLSKPEEMQLAFTEVKPALKLQGSGVILPSTDGLVFPFQAVNLKAVDVSVIRIYENNITQFLQINRLDGYQQLRRVGRKVVKKKINLTSKTAIDYGVWNNFTLDLTDIISAEPGALYRIELNFKKAYSLYDCGEEEEKEETEEEEDWDSYQENESSYWDYYEEDYYDYDYNWRERDNPCDKAYYRQNRKVSRNILASNVGIIAKMGKDKKLVVATTDIRTTLPISGATLKAYSYQNQLINEITTDSDGMAEIDLSAKPFLIVAESGSERGYLKLDDGSSLSLSQFDVRGQVVQQGIKGFIYGERGVWRPGDMLHLNFILEDKTASIPEGHPVKFELINPSGQVTKRMVKNSGLNGFYNFSVATEPEDPTGDWTARVKVGGATFTKVVKIEAIKPNRLKVKMDFGTEMLSVDQSDIEGDLEVKWLHGAVARNLRAQVSVVLSPSSTVFDGYSEYKFTDPARNFYGEEQTLFDEEVDSEGKATISADIEVRDAAPGMLKANFVTRVFEESGDFSIDRFSIPYSPYEKYVGIKTPKGDRRNMLLTDTLHTVELATLDTNGKPVSISDLEVSIYKVSWRWWWDSSEDNFGNYVGRSHENRIQNFKASTSNGKGKFTFKINYPDWGRYLIRVSDRKGGHSTGKIVYVDWPGWANRGERENPGGAAALSFSSDKAKYDVGEEAKISIPASGKGRALITVESGSKVITADWLEMEGKEQIHTIPVTAEMSPNAYVSITLVQPHVHENNLPIRLYGVIPLLVQDPATHLKPVLNMPDELAPESTIKVKVSEKSGKPMTYTLAIVDDGLLDLTRFSTPNPHPSFYAREALGIKTWDMYDDVIGAYGAQLERLLSIGGDEEAGGESGKKVNRFKPMVRFVGPFELDKNDDNEHVIDIPNYIGSVRTMVIAGQNGAYGKTEKTTPVKKPLMVLATLPRVLGPEEKVKLPVTVFAMDKKIKDVKVTVKANGLFKSGFTSSKSIRFTEMGDQVVNFELDVAKAIGKGKVTVNVSGAGEKASYDIELEVRNPNPPVTKFVNAVIEPNQSSNVNFEVFGVGGTNEGTLEFSNIPPIDFGRRLKYLIGYPHGCIEQTTSKAFPQLFIADVVEVEGSVKQRMSDNVKAALRKLNNFQHSSGGFTYWPGRSSINDWSTSYAGHFMIEAEAKGFSLPIGMKDAWLRYQRSAARNYNPKRINYDGGGRFEYAQAYRLYTLALAGKPEIGAMNRLKADNSMKQVGIWRLALTYYLAGQKEVAKKLVGNISSYNPTTGNDSYTYGSVNRDDAMILEAMSTMKMRNKAVSLVKQISNALISQRWMNTQSTAYSLLAMSKFAGADATSRNLKLEYTIEGKRQKLFSQRPVKMVDLDVSKNRNGSVDVKNTGDGVLFVRIATTGVPPMGEEEPKSNNLSLDVVYKTMQGDEIDPASIEQGTDFMAEVTVSHKNDRRWLRDIALTQIFPSGWEITNTRMDGTSSFYDADTPDYQDIRDDRVLTYFDLSRYTSYSNQGKSKKTFRVLLNAAYLGKYYLPAVSAESMYNNEISAQSAGKWVEVIRPGE